MERARVPAETFARQYEAAFICVPKGPCKSCGGTRGRPGKINVPEGAGKDFEPPRCKSWRMFVDVDGRCIVERVNEWC